uniref:Uncharacterized protein n=1 Tax=Arundo donax TaxID=35708 RepID=A0A0A8ZPQ0_ARUDO
MPLYAFSYSRQRFCWKGPGYHLRGDQRRDIKVLTPLCIFRHMFYLTASALYVYVASIRYATGEIC